MWPKSTFRHCFSKKVSRNLKVGPLLRVKMATKIFIWKNLVLLPHTFAIKKCNSNQYIIENQYESFMQGLLDRNLVESDHTFMWQVIVHVK